MKITDNTQIRATKTVREVAPGQVFSFECGTAILLMTYSNKYVRLLDGSLGNIANCDRDIPVKIYDHELILKGVL